MSVVGALQDLARRWGASVIAEGIETAAQLRVVRDARDRRRPGLPPRPAGYPPRSWSRCRPRAWTSSSLVKRDDWLHRMARAGAGMTVPTSAR